MWDRGSASKNRKGLRTKSDTDRTSAGFPVGTVQPVANPGVRRTPSAAPIPVRPARPAAASGPAPSVPAPAGGNRGADFWGIPLEATPAPSSTPASDTGVDSGTGSGAGPGRGPARGPGGSAGRARPGRVDPATRPPTPFATAGPTVGAGCGPVPPPGGGRG